MGGKSDMIIAYYNKFTLRKFIVLKIKNRI